ncbi:hypothetical protein [Vibrio sp. Hal054]|uniref:hypothetical protein n=1 Tax=Vibrio sp. Hal054 TaxID=3035158 RepID=UPI00301CEA3C
MKKLIEIPASLRLEVPADMSQEDMTKLVKALTYGDFAVYPDSSSGSLMQETKEHLLIDADDSLDKLVEQISVVDLWATENKFEVTQHCQ